MRLASSVQSKATWNMPTNLAALDSTALATAAQAREVTVRIATFIGNAKVRLDHISSPRFLRDYALNCAKFESSVTYAKGIDAPTRQVLATFPSRPIRLRKQTVDFRRRYR